MKKHFGLILVLWVISQTSPLCHAIVYEIIDLGSLGMNKSEAHDINNNGQIVGWSTTSDDHGHAFLWENGVMTDLGTLGIGSLPNGSWATGINETGQIVGSNNNGESTIYAFMYDNDIMRSIGYGYPIDINNNGTVVGYARSASYIGHTAVIFDNGQLIELGIGEQSGVQSEASAINNNGQIIGWVPKDVRHQGFLIDPPSGWGGSSVTYFGPSLGNHTYPYGINDKGQITGHSDGQVFLYEDGVITGLGINGHGWDINNHGQIVGQLNDNGHGFLYDNGIITDLGALPGHATSNAYAINDNGWIVGRSAVGDGHSWNAVLWKPIPEPATVLLLGIGAVMLRRKR